VPSINSVPAEKLALRPSRHVLYLAAAAIATTVTLVVVLSVFSPTHKRGAVAARTPPPSSATVEPAPRVPTPVLQTPQAQETEPAAATTNTVEAKTKANATLTAPRKGPFVDKRADNSLGGPSHRDSSAPIAKRRATETKPAGLEGSNAPTKSSGSGSKKSDGVAPAASWDQGTVETRSWMSPGF
jgi:hypothetical protein